jgi:hypothetical protein
MGRAYTPAYTPVLQLHSLARARSNRTHPPQSPAVLLRNSYTHIPAVRSIYCAEVRSRLCSSPQLLCSSPQLLCTPTRSHCAHSPQYLIGEDWWMQSSLILCIATSEMYINPGCRAIVIHLTFIPHHLHCASTATET